MTGGDSSDRDYAPHMWVLAEDGDSTRDEDYIFVGNATTFYRDAEAGAEYHVGVTALGELVGSVTTDNYKTSTGLPAEEIPDPAKRKLVEVGVRQISTLSGQIILSGLGIGVPSDLEPVDFGKAINGTPEQRAIEFAKREQWQQVEAQLRHELGIE